MSMICFTSPKGGVGKTTLAANVAHELAQHGQRVVAIDLDPQNALRLHFGVPLHDAAAFTCLLAQQVDWRRQVRDTASGVMLLPYGPSSATDALQLGGMVTAAPGLLLEPLRDMLSTPGLCVVVDTPPGPSPLLTALLPWANLSVTVLLADAASTSLIPAVERSNAEQNVPGGVFVLNQVDPRTRLGNVIADAAARHLGDRLLGMVYRDEFVGEAVAAQKLLSVYAPSSKANYDIAAISRVIQERLASLGTTQRSATPA
jgi:cellulose synthase operon protein YhjQ